MRLSIINQQTHGQLYGIMRFARDKNRRMDDWVREQVTGKTKAGDGQLDDLLNRIQTGDTLLMGELARLGRSTLDGLHALQILLDKKGNVFAIKEGYELNDDSQSKLVAFAFSMAAAIERNPIRRRSKEALALMQERGDKLGRPLGSQPVETKLSGKDAEVRTLLDKKIAHATIARLLGVDWRTVSSFINTWLSLGPSPEVGGSTS